MKLRPVILVLVLLTGFYYVTTRGIQAGKLFPALRITPAAIQQTGVAPVANLRGAFDLTEASAAPALRR